MNYSIVNIKQHKSTIHRTHLTEILPLTCNTIFVTYTHTNELRVEMWFLNVTLRVYVWELAGKRAVLIGEISNKHIHVYSYATQTNWTQSSLNAYTYTPTQAEKSITYYSYIRKWEKDTCNWKHCANMRASVLFDALRFVWNR